MTKVLISVLNMSIVASIIAIAVILVRLTLKKAPKIFSYILWIIVFLRLIFPIKLESSISLMPINAEIIPTTITMVTIPHINSGIVPIDEQVNLFMEKSMSQSNNIANGNSIQIVLLIGTYIWLCGLMILVIYAIIGYIKIKQQIYDATIKHENVFETDKISTAFVLGFIHPKIYIPTTVKNEQLDHILEHEQIHIMRKDYLIKPIAFFILTIHWFNPIIWLSYYLMSKDMEMSCDEMVLCKSIKIKDIRKEYSTSLIALYTPKSKLLNPLAFGEGSFKNMKAMIKNVLNFRQSPQWLVIICSFVLVIFMVGFTTNPPQKLTVNNLINQSVIKTESSNNNFYSAQNTPAFDYFQNNSIKKFLAMWVKEETGIENPKWNYDSFAKYNILDINGVSVSSEDLYYCTFSADNDRYGYIIVSYYKDGPAIQNKCVVETPYLYDLEKDIEKISNSLSKTNPKLLATEYEQWGITISNGIYYYNNTRIRIFFDTRSDNSFVNAFIDDEGNVDILLIRDNIGNIVKSELISNEDANEIIKIRNNDIVKTITPNNMYTSSSNKEKVSEIEDVNRLEISEALIIYKQPFIHIAQMIDFIS